MTEVVIIPMPEKYRSIPKLYRPIHPPIFQDCPESGPSEDDKNLARELFSLLDTESQDWYMRSCPWLREKRKKRQAKK